MLISIVIPVYNGARTIGPLVERLTETMRERPLQIVLVDDGSLDASDAACRGLSARHAGTVTYVKLSRNFGEHNAVMAGLWHARGDYAVIMDDDFQNPPEEVSRVIDLPSVTATTSCTRTRRSSITTGSAIWAAA